MRVVSKYRLASAIALLAFAVAYGAPSKDERLQVNEGKDVFTLMVPVSNLTMSIPKGGLIEGRNTHGGSANNPRYFYFQEKKESASIIVSGWFESQGRFSSTKKVWESDTKQWSRQGLPAPTNVSFQKIEGWDAVIYDMPLPGGSNTHIRAHWVQAGTWIDVHLSITAERPIEECREQVMALLKSITVKATK